MSLSFPFNKPPLVMMFCFFFKLKVLFIYTPQKWSLIPKCSLAPYTRQHVI